MIESKIVKIVCSLAPRSRAAFEDQPFNQRPFVLELNAEPPPLNRRRNSNKQRSLMDAEVFKRGDQQPPPDNGAIREHHCGSGAQSDLRQATPYSLLHGRTGNKAIASERGRSRPSDA
jgi:hypothetical protein